jgi:signal transduction histidine kinase
MISMNLQGSESLAENEGFSFEEGFSDFPNRSQDSKMEILKNVTLFNTFPERVLERLIDGCKLIHLSDEEILCEEGTVEKKMWVHLSGELLVYKLKKTIDVIKPGGFLGEMSLIDSLPRAASIRSVGDSLLIEIDNDFFHKEILTDPQAVLSIMQTLTNRARHNLDIIANECRQMNCMVHDMRNYMVPLTISEIHMNSLLKKLEGTTENHKKREGYNELNTGLKKMISVKNNVLTLIDQTLSISVRKKSDYVKAPADIVELVQETTEDTSCHKQLKNKQLKIITPQEPIQEIMFNGLDVKRVLQNLMINAGYASEKNGVIEVGVQLKEKEAWVYVTDHGTGIPDDVKPLLLKEKYTSKPDGNGFGLLSCREIIEEYHQGKFWFDSEWGKGTTFYFSLAY